MSFDADLQRRLTHAADAKQRAADHAAAVSEIGGRLSDPAQTTTNSDYGQLLHQVVQAIPARRWHMTGVRRYSWPDGSVHIQSGGWVDTALAWQLREEGPRRHTHGSPALDWLRNLGYDAKAEVFMAPRRAQMASRSGSQYWVQLIRLHRDSYDKLRSGERLFLFRDGAVFLCDNLGGSLVESARLDRIRFTPAGVVVYPESELWTGATPLPGREALLVMVQELLETGDSDEY